jgi:hypothetical protein
LPSGNALTQGPERRALGLRGGEVAVDAFAGLLRLLEQLAHGRSRSKKWLALSASTSSAQAVACANGSRVSGN